MTIKAEENLALNDGTTAPLKKVIADSQQRMLVPEALAEGEQLYSNILLQICDQFRSVTQ